MIAMIAEAGQVKLKRSGKLVRLQEIIEACAKVICKELTAGANLANDFARHAKAVLKLVRVLLLLVAETPKVFVREDAPQAWLPRIVIERHGRCAGQLFRQKLFLSPACKL